MPISEEQIVQVLLRDRDKLLAYTQSLVRNPCQAEDIFQDVSLRALRSREKIEDETHLLRWLRLAARHQCIAVLRSNTRSPIVMSEHLLNAIDEKWRTIDEQSSSEMMEALRHCLDQLSPYAKRLVNLRYVEGLTGRKLADRVHRKVQTVYVAISRIHRALFNCIQNRVAMERASHE